MHRKIYLADFEKSHFQLKSGPMYKRPANTSWAILWSRKTIQKKASSPETSWRWCEYWALSHSVVNGIFDLSVHSTSMQQERSGWWYGLDRFSDSDKWTIACQSTLDCSATTVKSSLPWRMSPQIKRRLLLVGSSLSHFRHGKEHLLTRFFPR